MLKLYPRKIGVDMQYQVPIRVSDWTNMDTVGMYKYLSIIDGSDMRDLRLVGSTSSDKKYEDKSA